MVIEESIHINTSAETLFDIYQDVSRWNCWDPDTKESFLDGPFAVGATGRLIPQETGTRVVHRVTFYGALNFVLGKIVGKQVREGLPATMRSLKTYAETMQLKTGQAHRSSSI